MRYCSKCGASVKEGQTYCSKCGHKLETSHTKKESSNSDFINSFLNEKNKDNLNQAINNIKNDIHSNLDKNKDEINETIINIKEQLNKGIDKGLNKFNEKFDNKTEVKTEVKQEDKRTTNQEETKVYRKVDDNPNLTCPTCGSLVKSTDTVCPNCGKPIIRHTTRSAYEFEVEYKKCQTTNERISLIEVFDIPRTTHDIIDFMTRALSLYNPEVYQESNTDYEAKRLADAWKNKFEEAYLKAKQSNEVNTNKDFANKIESLNKRFNEKLEVKEEIKKQDNKKKQIKGLKSLVLLGICLGIVGVSLYALNEQNEEKNHKMLVLDKENELVIEKVKDFLASGDLESARITVNEIESQANYSSSQDAKYQEIKDGLIETINNRLIELHDKKMADLVFKINQLILDKDFEEARVQALNLRALDISSNSIKEKYDEKRKALLLNIDTKELENHNQLIEEYRKTSEALLKDKAYDKARDYANLIVAISSNTKSEEININKTRLNLLDRIEAAKLNKPGNVMLSTSSTNLKGKDYKTVKSTLEAIGFRNIKLEVIEDLILGFLKSEGEVESVSIKGMEDFNKGDYFLKGDEVIISYHAFSDSLEDDEARTNLSSEEMIGENYLEIGRKLEKEGFNNIYVVALEDLYLGFLNEENTIESVSINGIKDFEKQDIFKKNAEVIIRYHSFKLGDN